MTVQRGGAAYGAVAVRVTNDDELADLYNVMAGKSPVWKQYLHSWGTEDTLSDFLAKKDRLIVLRLDPNNDVPFAPLRSDLIWIWPLIAALIIVWAKLR